MDDKKAKSNPMMKVAAVIVDKRKAVFLFFIIAAVFCAFAVSWVSINNDITTLMELKLVVANRQLAKYLYKSWVDKASTTYSIIYDNLLE